VDRRPKLDGLFIAILLAAIYLLAGVPFVEAISYRCLQFQLAAGSLLASTFLFFPPLCLLAMTGPFLIRLTTSNVQSLGGSVGRLTAISTLGSFIGTIMVGYLLIPHFGNATIMRGTAGALLLTGLVYFIVARRWTGSTHLAIVILLAAGTLGWAGLRVKSQTNLRGAHQLLITNSNFGQIQVFEAEQDNRRYYLNDFLVQNTYEPSSGQSLSLFTYMLHDLAMAYTTKIEKVLCIGMGVGIVPSRFASEGATTDVVEINPAIVPVAVRYFDLSTNQFSITLGDGRQLLNQTRGGYDAVILDAFLGDASPSHLMTREAFQAVKKALKPDGVLVINSFCDFEQGNDFLAASLNKTLKAVFASVKIHASGNGNVFFVASPNPDLSVTRPPAFLDIPHQLKLDAQRALAGVMQTDPAHGIVLTDDYNPTDYYDARNREYLRKTLAFSMHHKRAETSTATE